MRITLLLSLLLACSNTSTPASIEPTLAVVTVPEWKEHAHAFMVKVVDATDEGRKDCKKLIPALMRLEADAHALKAELDKAGKHLHDYVADQALQDRFFREPNPLVTCNNKALEAAIDATWFYAENGDGQRARAGNTK